jgi:hypothetical protein
MVAIKQIDMTLFDEESQLNALSLEIELMNNLKSDNIVTVY